MLEVRGVTKQFGGLTALRHVDFSVGDGELVGLVGPNGAGKSTMFNIVAGALSPTSGQVRLAGAMSPDSRATAWPGSASPGPSSRRPSSAS